MPSGKADPIGALAPPLGFLRGSGHPVEVYAAHRGLCGWKGQAPDPRETQTHGF